MDVHTYLSVPPPCQMQSMLASSIPVSTCVHGHTYIHALHASPINVLVASNLEALFKYTRPSFLSHPSSLYSTLFYSFTWLLIYYTTSHHENVTYIHNVRSPLSPSLLLLAASPPRHRHRYTITIGLQSQSGPDGSRDARFHAQVFHGQHLLDLFVYFK